MSGEGQRLSRARARALQEESSSTNAVKRSFEMVPSQELLRRKRSKLLPERVIDNVDDPDDPVQEEEEVLHEVEPLGTHIYQSNQVVYENKDFRMEILKTQFKKWSRFNIADHLFVLKCAMKSPTSQKPLLGELFEALEKSMDIILSEMKGFYQKPDHEHQIYVTGLVTHDLRKLKLQKFTNIPKGMEANNGDLL
jgi:hypothetical protein